jgi:hypothetical protein
MVEIAIDRPLFKTILVEMAYFVIHLHNRVNKSRIVVLLLCPEELELGKHLRCLPRCDHQKFLGCLDDQKCKKNGKKEQSAAFEPYASQFQTLP